MTLINNSPECITVDSSLLSYPIISFEDTNLLTPLGHTNNHNNNNNDNNNNNNNNNNSNNNDNNNNNNNNDNNNNNSNNNVCFNATTLLSKYQVCCIK
jgi:hypothetical protein